MRALDPCRFQHKGNKLEVEAYMKKVSDILHQGEHLGNPTREPSDLKLALEPRSRVRASQRRVRGTHALTFGRWRFLRARSPSAAGEMVIATLAEFNGSSREASRKLREEHWKVKDALLKEEYRKNKEKAAAAEKKGA